MLTHRAGSYQKCSGNLAANVSQRWAHIGFAADICHVPQMLAGVSPLLGEVHFSCANLQGEVQRRLKNRSSKTSRYVWKEETAAVISLRR